MRPVELVLSRLKSVRRCSDVQYTAKCPVHDDHHPSLSVKEAEDGRVLMYCHAGCRFEDIVRALGLELTDLFDTSSGYGGGRGR
jgi:hypothetical protein